MNLYKVSWPSDDDDQPGNVAWCGTQAEAKAKRKEVLNGYERVFQPLADITPVDFPTDKAGLLAWLNANNTKGD